MWETLEEDWSKCCGREKPRGQGQGHLEPSRWGNWQRSRSEGWGTLFLRGPGHQSCFHALGPGVAGAVPCEAWRAPGSVSVPTMAASLSPGFLLHHFGEWDPRAKTGPMMRRRLHRCSSMQRNPICATGRVSKGLGDAASLPRPAVYPELTPAQPMSPAPVQPPADGTAGKRQGREWGSSVITVPVYYIPDFCDYYSNDLKSEPINFGTYPGSYNLH